MTLTSEEFNKLVKKDDLKQLEERMEKKFASKDDVKKIEERVDKVSVLALCNKQDIHDLKESVKRIDKNVNTIITTLDGITKNFKDHQESHDINQIAHDRFEKIIGILEKRTGVSPVSV